MKKRISLGIIFGIIMVGLLFCFTTLSGIKDLNAQSVAADSAKQGDVIEYNITYAKHIYEIRHRLFGIIPIFSEHFYVTLNENGVMNPLVVRADEKWFSENFNANGFAKSPVQINVLIKKSSSKRGLSLDKVNEQIDEVEHKMGHEVSHIDSRKYADACYVSDSFLKIAAGILLVTVVLTFSIAVILVKKGVLIKGGVGVNIIAVVGIIQMIPLIVLMSRI